MSIYLCAEHIDVSLSSYTASLNTHNVLLLLFKKKKQQIQRGWGSLPKALKLSDKTKIQYNLSESKAHSLFLTIVLTG